MSGTTVHERIPAPRADERRSSLPTLQSYSRFARRHALLILGCMVVGFLLGLVWASQQPTTYSSSASVVLAPVPSYVSATTQQPPPEVTIDTDAQLVGSHVVTDALAEAADEDAATVTDRLVVTATPLSRVLHLTFTDESPSEAAAGAAAAAEALIEIRGRALAALRRDQTELLGLRIRTLQDRLNNRMSRTGFVSPQEPVVVEIRELRTRLAELERLRVAPAVLSQEPVIPTSPDANDAEVPLTSGAMMGLLIGCAVGAALDRRRNSGAVDSR